VPGSGLVIFFEIFQLGAWRPAVSTCWGLALGAGRQAAARQGAGRQAVARSGLVKFSKIFSGLGAWRLALGAKRLPAKGLGAQRQAPSVWTCNFFEKFSLGAGRQAVLTCWGLALGAQRQAVALVGAWRRAPSGARIWTCNFFGLALGAKRF